MSNPYLNRLAERGGRGDGKRSEKLVAASLNARLHPNSGSMAGAKSDASRGQFRLEMKSTVHQTLKLERAWLDKINHEALRHGQRPALVMTFTENDGRPAGKDVTWVAIPKWVFEELIEPQ